MEEVNHNEKNRIHALESYNVLDTLSEEEYDDITEIASTICEMPIALVSLVDSNRQFFKSHHGLDINETPRAYSFCSVAIETPDNMMIIEDSRKDDRFKDNPIVTGYPHVIFYAGMPLVNPDGYPLGTLCVIDNKPNNLTEKQKNNLKSLGKQVVSILELRRKNILLKSSQEKLTLLAQEMENFAQQASHDLKEPLRMITSFLELFEIKYFKTLNEEGKKYIKIASDSANRLHLLIDDLLEFSMVGNNQDDLKTIDLNEVIEEIKKLLFLEIEEKKAKIIYSNLPKIKGSEIAIKQLFQNLISNAIKYQSKNNEPIITITGKNKNTYWEFSVCDNGIGINKDYIDSIFTIFKRLHRKEEYPGTGIGLAICKKIVKQHHGEIWVESIEGKGSCFNFTILK